MFPTNREATEKNLKKPLAFSNKTTRIEVEFEFDPVKSDANVQKHGIDFERAQALWHDSRRLALSAASDDEPRYALVAGFEDKIWLAIYTMRGERIRIISVRRARRREVNEYEQEKRHERDSQH